MPSEVQRLFNLLMFLKIGFEKSSSWLQVTIKEVCTSDYLIHSPAGTDDLQDLDHPVLDGERAEVVAAQNPIQIQYSDTRGNI